MTFLTSRADPVAGGAAVSLPALPRDNGRLRRLSHAIADLRRGHCCRLLTGGGGALLLAAAETAAQAGVTELVELAGARSLRLLLTEGRVGVAGSAGSQGDDRPVAFRLDDQPLDPLMLRGLADPTSRQRLDLAALRPAGEVVGAAAAIALAKRARLLPALVVVPIDAAGDDEALPAGLATVEEGDLGDLGHLGDLGQLSDLGGAEAEEAAQVEFVAEAAVPLAGIGDSRVLAFRVAEDGGEHFAVMVGRPERAAAPLVRIHSECFTGDLLGSLRCDCGPQLQGALERMAGEGAGALLYLAQEGRGIGLVNKLRAYALQDRGLDTLDANRALGWGADERGYHVAAAMLRMLGLTRVRLLTNNPRKVAALSRNGIVVERVSHLFAGNGVNDAYLASKVARFGHLPE